MKILGVLDGGDMGGAQLRAWAQSADLVIAADGAADVLLGLGVHPTIIVGDMDTMQGDPGSAEVLRDEDPSSTDCDKLLRWVRGRPDAQFTLTNLEGDLPDHVMATLSSCVAFRRPMRLAFRRGIGWVFSGSMQVNTAPGARVSLLPLTPCNQVRLHGVEWPLDGADLEMGGLVSISNRSKHGFVQASIGRGFGFLFAAYAEEEMPFWV